MYKRAVLALMAGYLLLFGGVIFSRSISELSGDEIVSSQGKMEYALDGSAISREKCVGLQEENMAYAVKREGIGIAQYSSSDKRVVDYQTLRSISDNENASSQAFSEKEIAVLERIVEAEAGGEDEKGKLLVANVVLNRVKSEDFPDTIEEVVFQRTSGTVQFSPVASGRYDEVEISEETKEIVGRALAGEDVSEGALYFASRKHASSKNMCWFDENLCFLFKHGGHEFFK